MATDAEIIEKLSNRIFRKTLTTKTIIKQAAQLLTDPEWDSLALAMDNNDQKAFFDIIKVRRDEKVRTDSDTEATTMWSDFILNKTEVERLLF